MNKRTIISLLLCAFVVVIGMLMMKRASRPREAGQEKPHEQLKESAEGDKQAVEPTSGGSDLVEPGDSVAGDVDESITHQLRIVKKLKSMPMSSSVKKVISFDGDGSDRDGRINALRHLPRSLSADDREALTLFLDMRFNDQENLGRMKLETYNGIKNAALDVLTRQKNLPDGLGLKLVDMYNDQKHDDLWRDYCVQYLDACYSAEKKKTTPDPETIKKIESTYWQALEERGKTIAGTSLLALERLSQRDSDIDRAKVESVAIALATDNNCGEAARITALRIAAKMGKKEVLPSARMVAQIGATTMLRMAAIATLGDIGDESDIELLESYSKSNEKRISKVAVSAHERLSKRIEEVSVAANKGV